MADKEAGEIPKGLSMSLDALIKEEKGRPGQQKQQNGNMGNRRDVRGQQRGRGRGPHGQSGRGGRGRFNDFPQQTWQVQRYLAPITGSNQYSVELEYPSGVYSTGDEIQRGVSTVYLKP